MNQPFVSFIIPVYKAEKYLGRCVQSIMAQQFDDWELILVDDESPDTSGKMCDELAVQDERIQVIHRKNGGQGAARNTGVSVAAGKWLMFIDDDDWLDKNMYTECAPYLTDDIDILTFCRRDVYSSGSKDRKISLSTETLAFDTESEKRALQINMLNFYAPYKYDLSQVLFVTPWGKFFRRSFWVENQLTFVEGPGEDRPCLLRAYGCARKVLHVNKCYYNYWIHESTIRKYVENAFKFFDLSLKVIHQYVNDNLSNSEECLEALRHTDIAYFSHYVVQDYCHRLNPQSYIQRKERFLADIEKNSFNKAFKKADLSCLPLRRKVLAILIRGENFFLINSMCRINDLLNKLIYNQH